jgi:hypothetical protein
VKPLFKSKGGRPRLDAKAAKSAIFPIRLSREERAAIAVAAELAGMKDSEWARRALLAAASDSRIVEERASPGGLRSR